MRLGITVLTIFLLLVSCGEKVIEPPENLIPQEKMTSILYDLAVLNSTRGTNPSILKKNDIELMPFIFEKYKIDSLQFAQSDLYYASIPLQYQTIYEAVETRLENEVSAIEKEKERKRDSIKKASQIRRDSLKVNANLSTNDSLSNR